MAAVEFEWKEPTPRLYTSHVFDYETIEAKLKENPGRWALVATYANRNSASASIISLKYRKNPAFEVTVRTNEEGRGDVYLRYIG